MPSGVQCLHLAFYSTVQAAYTTCVHHMQWGWRVIAIFHTILLLHAQDVLPTRAGTWCAAHSTTLRNCQASTLSWSLGDFRGHCEPTTLNLLSHIAAFMMHTCGIFSTFEIVITSTFRMVTTACSTAIGTLDGMQIAKCLAQLVPERRLLHILSHLQLSPT